MRNPYGQITNTDSRSLRTAPVPTTISQAAQRQLAKPAAPRPADLASHRASCDEMQENLGARQLERYAVRVKQTRMGDVPVRIFTPQNASSKYRGCVLLNLHGGGFIVDSGSITENIPLAFLSGIPVVSALYRLAPEHEYPLAVDDAQAVYSALLEKHRPQQIGIYGTSAGAVLSVQLLARLKDAQAPYPRALGFFSGSADLSRAGDSEYFLAPMDDRRPLAEIVEPYIQGCDKADPRVSPLYMDLTDFPPTLCISGTRDFMLSQTVIFHQALLRAKIDARLVVFEAMPHAHWCYLDIPECDEAFEVMAEFFKKHLLQ